MQIYVRNLCSCLLLRVLCLGKMFMGVFVKHCGLTSTYLTCNGSTSKRQKSLYVFLHKIKI